MAPLTVSPIVVFAMLAVLGLAGLATAVVAVTAVAAPVRPSPPVRSAAGLLAATAALVAAAAVAEVADQVVDGGPVTRVDLAVWRWFLAHRSPGLTTAATAVSAVGSTGVLGVAVVVVAGWLWWRGRRGDALLAAGVTVGAVVTVEVLKTVVARPRPPLGWRLAVETNPSFPSGHALGDAAVGGVLAAIAVRALLRRGRRGGAVAVATVGCALVVAVGLSRLYLGVHWSSDVAAGWLLGGLWLGAGVVARTAVGDVGQAVRS